MKKLFTKIAVAVAGITGVAFAQQDPQFTQWMYNKLIFNPGYAGTSGAICGVAQFRQQWASFTGAPQTIAVAADMRLQGDLPPIGLGINIINDKIGPMSTNFARLAGSWNQKIGAGVLGIGIDAGILQKSISSSWIVPEPGKVDPTIPGNYDANTNPSLNKVTYDVGFGAFYQKAGDYYVGLSSTHLPAQSVGSGDVKYDLTRHYYVMGGYTFHINSWNDLTANLKYKSDLAAGALDANLTYMWSKTIWVGGTYRMNDAAAVLLGWQSREFGGGYTAKIGYSYDFILSKIKGYSSGTHEILLGVCYVPKIKKLTVEGNDRFLD